MCDGCQERHCDACCHRGVQPYEQVLNGIVSTVDDLLVGLGLLTALIVVVVVVAGVVGSLLSWLFG